MNEHLATAKKMGEGMGIILSLGNTEFLEEECLLHKTADSMGLTECQCCGYCCLRRPCVPTPEEIPAIASYLKLSLSELAEQHMVADIHKNEYYLLWAQETQLDLLGKLLPYYRTYDRGYCHFFDRGTHLCKIYPVRPAAATRTTCWNDSEAPKVEPRAQWNISFVKQLLPNFVGEEE